MTSRTYLWGVGLASALALASFLALIWFFSPENSSGIILILLALSLFLSLCGFFSLLGFYIRRRKQRDKSAIYFLGISFREGSLLGLLFVGFLAMKFFQVFYWWTALIFLIIVVAIELAFLYGERS
ncbi:hypothetical protein KJ853_00330 [Patescibacteria group bacterium]|nr:hypothetical protein [Patescibacteria group bacterium]